METRGITWEVGDKIEFHSECPWKINSGKIINLFPGEAYFPNDGDVEIAWEDGTTSRVGSWNYRLQKVG